MKYQNKSCTINLVYPHVLDVTREILTLVSRWWFSGLNHKAFLLTSWLVIRGGIVLRDRLNFKEKQSFFDLKAREEITRDILTVSQQVDVARLRLLVPRLN